MNVADLTGLALDYWVARSLHDFVREIHFTDSGETVSIRGNDRGRPWDGRFTPSTSWEAAAAVLERAQRLEVRERTALGAAHCVAEFEGGHRTVEGRGDSLRVALLRAFVESRFGDTVGDVLREAQAVSGEDAQPIGEQTAGSSFVDLPSPDGQIGDIQSAPR
ncbi:phage protein NinX family protein [Paraburkholderia dipogonis]|uniref:phage protein NinX family protein n=1 Tax=Paraburkholderia dipogonis TaxID=1211383 RepID=UPI0038B73C5D